MGKMKKKIVFLIMLMMLWFIGHIAVIVIDGLNDELGYADAAVVLGNKVELNGEPSVRLKDRLDKAAELYEEGYYKHIIVSGGIGKEGFDEAEVMKDCLVGTGIPGDSIIVDSKGNNTFMTAKNSKEIMIKSDLSSVMVISQFYHITRCKLAFRRVGFEKVYAGHSSFFEIKDIYSLIREFFGYYKYLFMKI